MFSQFLQVYLFRPQVSQSSPKNEQRAS